jgi:hypothetical protein
MSAGSGVVQLHALLAIASAVLAAAIVIVGACAGLGLVTAGRGRRWMDRTLLGLIGAVALASVVGVVVLVLVGPPREWLHLVYAAAALWAVPVARAIAGARASTRIGWWVAAGGLVTLAALLRLWGTGT